MALFNAVNLNYVVTGALGISFNSDSKEDIASITVTADDGNTLLEYPNVEWGETDYDNWYTLELVGPLAYNTPYTVTVDFENQDGDTESYTDTLTIPVPKYNRSSVLRQRLYEILLGLDSEGFRIYGTSHRPLTVGHDFKADDGITVELKSAYISNSVWETHEEMSHEVSIPLVLYATIDDPEDVQSLSIGLEIVWGYINTMDWNLANFNVSQRQVSIDANAPEINQDRRLASLSATITIPVSVAIL